MSEEIERIYVVHPVSKEQKKALRRKFGVNIVDARYAPKGADLLTADGEKYSPPKPKSTK